MGHTIFDFMSYITEKFIMALIKDREILFKVGATTVVFGIKRDESKAEYNKENGNV